MSIQEMLMTIEEYDDGPDQKRAMAARTAKQLVVEYRNLRTAYDSLQTLANDHLLQLTNANEKIETLSSNADRLAQQLEHEQNKNSEFLVEIAELKKHVEALQLKIDELESGGGVERETKPIRTSNYVGTDFEKIMGAITAAAAATDPARRAVWLDGGQYHIHQPIELSGSAFSNLRIFGDGWGDTTIHADQQIQANHMFRVNGLSSNIEAVTLFGFSLNGNMLGSTNGLYVTRSRGSTPSGVLISGVHVHNFSKSGIMLQGHGELTNCISEDNKIHGVVMTDNGGGTTHWNINRLSSQKNGVGGAGYALDIACHTGRTTVVVESSQLVDNASGGSKFAMGADGAAIEADFFETHIDRNGHHGFLQTHPSTFSNFQAMRVGFSDCTFNDNKQNGCQVARNFPARLNRCEAARNAKIGFAFGSTDLICEDLVATDNGDEGLRTIAGHFARTTLFKNGSRTAQFFNQYGSHGIVFDGLTLGPGPGTSILARHDRGDVTVKNLQLVNLDPARSYYLWQMIANSSVGARLLHDDSVVFSNALKLSTDRDNGPVEVIKIS